MIVPIIAAIGGALFARRGAPTGSVKAKRQMIGRLSGVEYLVDDYGTDGVLHVHFDGSVGYFKRRTDKPGMAWLHGSGDPQVLAMMIRDII